MKEIWIYIIFGITMGLVLAWAVCREISFINKYRKLRAQDQTLRERLFHTKFYIRTQKNNEYYGNLLNIINQLLKKGDTITDVVDMTTMGIEAENLEELKKYFTPYDAYQTGEVIKKEK